ncbi:MAG: hypothetical protein AB7N80_15815 [Bdellovibrionales bacterium]
MLKKMRLMGLVCAGLVACNTFAADKKKPAAKATAPATTKAPEVKLTPEQEAKYKELQKYLNDTSLSYAQYPIDMCGQKLDITMDKAMVPAFMEASANPELYCEEVRTKISLMCRNAADLKNNNKKKLTTLIKKIDCKLGTGEQADFKISGGLLTFTVGPKASNLSEKFLAFIDGTDDPTEPKKK